MYLKRVEMVGFKSFADKTVIHFEKGITAIVGPNGCGKSNISDAIRWVLGEKSSKMLRGGKMEDMIFNGTEFRKSAGFCEVSMVFSNEDGVLPIEYTEVAITRKYFRDGESEYYINRAPCRQKDIYALLMDTGIGSNSYCMVEQGRIDYIVRASADERRFLIEEAAGISKYKYKKAEAMRKLERTENNLLRLNDIVAEVEKNIKYAERQARKAEKYKERYDQLKRLELFKSFQEIDELKVSLEDFTARKQARENSQGGYSKRLQEARGVLQEKSIEIESLNETLATQEEERYQQLNDIDKLKRKAEFNTIRSAELTARNETNSLGINEAKAKITINRENIDVKNTEYETFQSEISTIDHDYQEKQMRLQELNADLARIKETVSQYERDVFEVAARIANEKNEISKNYIEATNLENKVSRIQAETEKRHAQKREHEERLSEKQANLAQQRDELDLFSQQYERTKQVKRDKEAEQDALREEILNKRIVYKELEARLHVLEDIAKGYSGFKDGAKKALQLKDEQSPLFQSISTLVSALDVKVGYEVALQAVLADRIYSVVGSNHRDAYEIIKHLRDNNLGQITILVNRDDMSQDDVAIPYDPAFILGPAINFVSVTPENKFIVKEILKKTLVITDEIDAHYNEVVELSRRFRLVTRSGVVIGPNIYMSGGSDSESNTEMLTRDRKIKELQSAIAAVSGELQLSTSRENNVIGQLNDIRGELESYEKTFYDQKVQIETTAQVSHSFQEMASKIDAELETLAKELEESRYGISRLHAEREERENTLRAYERKHEIAQEILVAEKNTLNDMNPEREKIQMELAGLTAKITGLREKDTFMVTAITSLKNTVTENEQFITRVEAEIRANEEIIDRLLAENEEADRERAETEDALRTIELELSRMHSERDDAMVELHVLQDEVNTLNTDLENCKEELHEYSMKIMDLHYRENAIHDRLLQAYKIELKEIDRTTIELTEDEQRELRALILDLSEKVDAMGAVNLMAVEEYDSLKQRYEFLTTQRDDLETARSTLLEAIRKINRTTKKLFLDVFTLIKRYFNDYYTTLFKGGHAELILLDGENPLESGIDIFVRPPGKKLQNISLLSGGEKALTAIALLFAVFKVKPSPYCLLDEVDAPLDEANIDRFLEVVKDFLETTQFLIVTHNRKTIAIADTLFGITMEEAGVSKVVSVKLSEADDFIDDTVAAKDKRDGIYKPKKNYNTSKLDELVQQEQ